MLQSCLSGWPEGKHKHCKASWGYLDMLGCHAGLSGYGTQICMTFALKYVKAAPALAMSYLSVVWSILYGYYIFRDVRLPLCPVLSASLSVAEKLGDLVPTGNC